MVSKRTLKQIARERIEILFAEAAEQFDEHPERAHRYMEISRKVAMKVNFSIPAQYKRKMCRECGHYLSYGNNARVRLDSERHLKIITCEDCGAKKRIPYD